MPMLTLEAHGMEAAEEAVVYVLGDEGRELSRESIKPLMRTSFPKRLVERI